MNRILTFLLSVITGKILRLFFLWIGHLIQRIEIKRKNKVLKEELKNAKTKEERENAARNLIDNS